MKWTGHADKPLPAIIAHKGIKEKLKRQLHMSWPKKGVQPRHRYWNITLSLEMLRPIRLSWLWYFGCTSRSGQLTVIPQNVFGLGKISVIGKRAIMLCPLPAESQPRKISGQDGGPRKGLSQA
jgi:hypothetical protein